SIDLLLATGDLSQDGSAASYRTFLRMAARIPAPLRAFPGNHDLHDPLRGIAGDSPLLEPVVDCGAWRIVLLDTAVPDAVHEIGRASCRERVCISGCAGRHDKKQT